MWLKGLNIFFMSKILLQVLDLVILLFNQEKLFMLQILELLELNIVVFLEFKDNLFKKDNLGSLTLVSVKLKWLIEEIIDVWTLYGSLDLINSSLSLDDLEVDLLHIFDFSLLFIGSSSCKSCFLVCISLSCLVTKFTLCDCQDWLLLAITFLLVHVLGIELIVFLSLSTETLLNETLSSLGN